MMNIERMKRIINGYRQAYVGLRLQRMLYKDLRELGFEKWRAESDGNTELITFRTKDDSAFVTVTLVDAVVRDVELQ